MINDKLELCVEAYKEIIFDKKPFYNVISEKIYSSKFEKKDKMSIISIVGATIRHFYLFRSMLKSFGKLESDDSFYFLSCCLTDLYFTRRFPRDELFASAKECLEYNEPNIDSDSFEKFFSTQNPSDYLKNSMKSSRGNTYLSIRFNVPEWIIDMWTKQYSRSICIKTISELSSKQKQYVKINKELETSDLVLPSNSFKQSDIYPDLYEYIGNQQARHDPLILKNKVYITNIIENELSKKIHLNCANNIAFYFYEKNNFHIDLMNLYKDKARIGLFSNDYTANAKALEYIKKYQGDKVYYDQANISELSSRIVNTANLFVLLPNNSNFNYVNYSPEYLINFNTKELDRMIIKERQDLEEASKLVIMAGYLVYFTHTMNKKENSELIKNFLSEHKNYELICEKEYLLTNKTCIFGYYAILTRTY